MNCTEFENYLLGLGSGELARDWVLAHAESCETCDTRLKEMQQLQSLMSQIAREDLAIDAPTRIEQALIDDIRRRRHVAPATMAFPNSLWTRKFAKVIGTAALVSLALAASIVYSRRSGNQGMVGPNDPKPGAAKEEPNNVAAGGDHDGSRDREGAKPTVLSTPGINRGARGTVAQRPRRRTAGETMSEGERPIENAEIATEYFPINYGTYLQPIDSGQIVRIALPRSVLGSYGLPVDPLQADQPINADVVIGNDGIARAIRFVR